MVPEEFVIFSVSGMLKHSKSRSWHDDTITAMSTLCRFLQDNGLVNRELVKNGQQVSESLEVRRKDFTNEGFELYRRAHQRWFSAQDRGTPLTNTTILERELQELRKENLKDA